MERIWKSMPTWCQVFTIMATVLTAGMALGRAVIDYNRLPEQIEANKKEIVTMQLEHGSISYEIRGLKTSIENNGASIRRVICLQEAEAGLTIPASCAR